ncbi:MAG: class II fructose-bisphosphatase [Acidimicrobiia bacterium]|nr:class II fructose-bisphosphatase [Acidimicrobiia bacterium]MDH3396379.1 class II fructose-bisphosphatase [Acidimicrobiia bacterium]
MAELPERNLALELVRVTEAAAMAAARWQGRGDKEGVDQAAVDGMRSIMATVEMDGIIVIGEGEKDEAPMLYNGEKVGNGKGIAVDVAVDPVDGTTLTADGMPGALAVIGLAERGSMYAPGSLVYMDKIAVGPEAAGMVDLEAPVERNLTRVAKALKKDINDLTAIILDRPRNRDYIQAVREAGARIRLIRDGDVSGAISTVREETGIDILLGIGGSPEAVIAASALLCMGGEIQCKLWPRDESERQYALENDLDLDQILTTRDLVDSDNVFFAATGVTDGELLDGVDYYANGARTHSVVMRSRTGSIRFIDTHHDLRKLKVLSAVEYG